MKYWLASSAYLCATTDGFVLLDLRKDEYLGLDAAQVGILNLLVEGWPATTQERIEDPSSLQQRALDVANALVKIGLLTTDASAGKCAAPVCLEHVDMTPLQQRLGDKPNIRVGHFINFILACLGALYTLRRYPLEVVIARAKTRKHSRTKQLMPAGRRQQWELADIFRRLQSYGYTSKNRCLFNSLALINFLARYHYFPLWVMGVRTNPFAAHSWVQEEEVVLDGRPENACFYTPILMV